jgi:osmotically-inducible protein OsmY
MQRNSLVAFFVVGGLTLVSVPAGAQTAARPAPAAQAQNTDDALENRIEYRLETNATTRKYDVRVKVRNGVATLEGDVATAAQKAEAERIAKIDGVTRVENKIDVDPDEDKSVTDRVKAGLSKTGETITDAWITTKVKWFFLGEDELKGSDINVDTNNKTVTLKGTVKTQAGKQKANQLARDTDGVSKVVDQLVIKNVP